MGRYFSIILRAALLCAVFATGATAHASAWSRENGRLLIIARADYFTSDLGLINVGGADVSGMFERFESNTYLEYGVTDRWMIGGKVFYGTSWLTRGPDTETASGVTEYEAFAQYQIFRNAFHAGAIKVAGGVPSDFESGARPSLETDGFDLEAAALYGRTLSFEPVATFINVELGYRKRISDAADQLRFLTTIGIEPSNRWALLLDTYSVKSLQNERNNGVDFDVIKIQPSVVWSASKRFSIQAGVTEEVAGRNINLGRTYFIGLRTQF